MGPVVMVLGGVLLFALAAATTMALYLGLLGAIGAVRLARCRRCGHLAWTAPGALLRSCPFCRHRALFHPAVTLHEHRRRDRDGGMRA